MPALDPLKNISANEVLYERRCANYIYVAPAGLRELMSDISREVLHNTPDNICCFIADYLESLMVTRENARVAMKFVDVVTDTGLTVSNLITGSNITKEEADKAARIIQRAVRAYFLKLKKHIIPLEYFDEDDVLQKIVRRAKITVNQAIHAATVIQTAYRGYRKRLHESLEEPMIDWRSASHRTIEVFKSAKPMREEMNKAATLIKAAYKGYYTRRLIRQLLAKKIKSTKLLNYSINIAVLEKAAITIQRAFRAYLLKKEEEDIQEDKTDNEESKENLAINQTKLIVQDVIDDTMDAIQAIEKDGSYI